MPQIFLIEFIEYHLIRGQGPGLVTSLVFFPCFVMQKIRFFSKIHSFSKPVPLPPVRKWQTDLPETRKCAVSPTKTYLATYRSAGVKAPRGLLNLWRMRSLALLSSSPLRPDGPTRTQFPVQSLFEVELSTKGLRTLFSSVSIYCAFPPCSPAPRAPELSSSVSIFCAITVCSESQPSPLSAPSPFSDYK